MRTRIGALALLLSLTLATGEAQTKKPVKPVPKAPPSVAPALKSANIPFVDAWPILQFFAEDLPDGLKGKDAAELEKIWPGWVASRDAEIRERLGQGDEDTVVNFLLFGVSYTRQPRATERDLAKVGKDRAAVIEARVADLTSAVANPGANERLVFVRGILSRKGINPATPDGKAKTKEYLLDSLARVLAEVENYQRAIQAAQVLGDTSAEFFERSQLYKTRGLSLDTSIFPNVSIEQSLQALRERGYLPVGGVRRVAIVGPGLDFTDKGEGYDFYPQQTLQPFAVIDSLLRLGLIKSDDFRLTTFDLSDRINQHLAAARDRARRGVPYVVQLPRDASAPWKPETITFWEQFGSKIGAAAKPVAPPPGSGDLKIRAVSIRPAVVLSITPHDLNIVLQRVDDLPASEQFDLIIATNILVYYDHFEQSLALANIGRLLRPGGLLLSNNALPELPTTPVHSVGYKTTVYSDRPDDGDHLVWYQRQ